MGTGHAACPRYTAPKVSAAPRSATRALHASNAAMGNRNTAYRQYGSQCATICYDAGGPLPAAPELLPNTPGLHCNRLYTTPQANHAYCMIDSFRVCMPRNCARSIAGVLYICVQTRCGAVTVVAGASSRAVLGRAPTRHPQPRFPQPRSGSIWQVLVDAHGMGTGHATRRYIPHEWGSNLDSKQDNMCAWRSRSCADMPTGVGRYCGTLA